MLSKVSWKCCKPEPICFAVIAKVIHSAQWCPQCWQERRQPPKPAIPIESVAEVTAAPGLFGSLRNEPRTYYVPVPRPKRLGHPITPWSKLVIRLEPATGIEPATHSKSQISAKKHSRITQNIAKTGGYYRSILGPSLTPGRLPLLNSTLASFKRKLNRSARS
jgi:hypothetical protein